MFLPENPLKCMPIYIGSDTNNKLHDIYHKPLGNIDMVYEIRDCVNDVINDIPDNKTPTEMFNQLFEKVACNNEFYLVYTKNPLNIIILYNRILKLLNQYANTIHNNLTVFSIYNDFPKESYTIGNNGDINIFNNMRVIDYKKTDVWIEITYNIIRDILIGHDIFYDMHNVDDNVYIKNIQNISVFPIL